MAITLDFVIRIFLGVYFTAIAAFYIRRLVFCKGQKKRLFVGKFVTSHWFAHILFRVFRSLILFICVARIFFPAVDNYLLVCFFINTPVINLVGIFFLVFGFAVVLSGHVGLGEQWRSGIDLEGTGGLVTTRLYARTRNPIYIGVMIAQLGFFLALPSVFTFICLIAGATAILNQVRLEEIHLLRRFSDDYREYCQRVPRWLY